MGLVVVDEMVRWGQDGRAMTSQENRRHRRAQARLRPPPPVIPPRPKDSWLFRAVGVGVVVLSLNAMAAEAPAAGAEQAAGLTPKVAPMRPPVAPAAVLKSSSLSLTLTTGSWAGGFWAFSSHTVLLAC